VLNGPPPTGGENIFASLAINGGNGGGDVTSTTTDMEVDETVDETEDQDAMDRILSTDDVMDRILSTPTVHVPVPVEPSAARDYMDRVRLTPPVAALEKDAVKRNRDTASEEQQSARHQQPAQEHPPAQQRPAQQQQQAQRQSQEQQSRLAADRRQQLQQVQRQQMSETEQRAFSALQAEYEQQQANRTEGRTRPPSQQARKRGRTAEDGAGDAGETQTPRGSGIKVRFPNFNARPSSSPVQPPSTANGLLGLTMAPTTATDSPTAPTSRAVPPHRTANGPTGFTLAPSTPTTRPSPFTATPSPPSFSFLTPQTTAGAPGATGNGRGLSQSVFAPSPLASHAASPAPSSADTSRSGTPFGAGADGGSSQQGEDSSDGGAGSADAAPREPQADLFGFTALRRSHEFIFRADGARASQWVEDEGENASTTGRTSLVGSDGTWVTRGTGPMVLLRNRASDLLTTQLLTDPAGRTVLNRRVLPTTNYKEVGQRSLRWVDAGLGGQPEVWLVRFASESDRDAMKIHLDRAQLEEEI
jgi:hypothetical protein